MKIASITIFCNEIFRLQKWIEYYNVYKNEIFMHIIVNNGEKEDSDLLKTTFPHSIVLESDTKSLCTAYNVGLNHIQQSDAGIDSVLFLGNDIKIEYQTITRLWNYLYSDQKYGMVSPVVLEKDSDVIETYGADFNPYTLRFIHLDRGNKVADVLPGRVCGALPGAINLSRKEFYPTIGNLDDDLYMYYDEVDIALRAQKMGYLLAVTSSCVVWHQHSNIGSTNARSYLAAFFQGRNGIYLSRKYLGFISIFCTAVSALFEATLTNAAIPFRKLTKSDIKYRNYYALGVFYGIINCKKIPE